MSEFQVRSMSILWMFCSSLVACGTDIGTGNDTEYANGDTQTGNDTGGDTVGDADADGDADTDADSDTDSDCRGEACLAPTDDDTDTAADIDTDTDTDSDIDTDTDSDIDTDTDSDSDCTGGACLAPTDDDTDTDTDSQVPPQNKSCKRGVSLEYGKQSDADMAALSPGISWWYNWATGPEQGQGDAIDTYQMAYVPMWWGTGISIASVEGAIRDDATYILGFNEPNFFSQANLSAEDAAAAWPDLETVADAYGLMLVSPSVNFCGGGCHDTNPFDYLDDFFAACPGCRVDAIAIHIYVGCRADDPGLQNNRAQWLINHVNTYKSRFDKPLWLTEFACSDAPSQEEQIAFMEDAVTFLENEPRIARYAWFAGRVNVMTHVNLLAEDGTLSAIGETYMQLPFANDFCE